MSCQLQTDVSLRPYNTLGIDVRARWFAQPHCLADVRQLLAWCHKHQLPLNILGEGSNVLLTRDLDGVVVRMALRGVQVVLEQGHEVWLRAAAGESWANFVQLSLALGLGGLENLSLIPGTVGAAPVQNIGAYGVELADVVAEVTAVDRHSGQLKTLNPAACRFAYRDSLFKQEPDRWIITQVLFRLSRQAPLRLDYGGLRQYLQQQGVSHPDFSAVSRAVCAMRREKLPDPATLGNAGSFFKNPLVDASLAKSLRQRYPDVVSYPQGDGQVKLAAGWLIDQAGWKGRREGDVGVHQSQALVLVNHGYATGEQVLQLAQRIQADISGCFGVQLEMEPVAL